MRKEGFRGITFDLESPLAAWLQNHAKKNDTDVAKLLRKLVRDLKAEEEAKKYNLNVNYGKF